MEWAVFRGNHQGHQHLVVIAALIADGLRITALAFPTQEQSATDHAFVKMLIVPGLDVSIYLRHFAPYSHIGTGGGLL